MKSCNDLKNLANYMSTSSTTIQEQAGKKRFFIPFFREKIPELFKKAVMISSIYLNMSSINSSTFSTNLGYQYKFKINIQIPDFNNTSKVSFAPKTNSIMAQIVEKSTDISKSDFEYTYQQIANEIKTNNIQKIDYSFLEKSINNIFNMKEGF